MPKSRKKTVVPTRAAAVMMQISHHLAINPQNTYTPKQVNQALELGEAEGRRTADRMRQLADRGIIQRLSPGVYAALDHEPKKPNTDISTVIRLPRLLRAVIDAEPEVEHTVEDLARLVDFPEKTTEECLKKLFLQGAIAKRGTGAYVAAFERVEPEPSHIRDELSTLRHCVGATASAIRDLTALIAPLLRHAAGAATGDDETKRPRPSACPPDGHDPSFLRDIPGVRWCRKCGAIQSVWPPSHDPAAFDRASWTIPFDLDRWRAETEASSQHASTAKSERSADRSEEVLDEYIGMHGAPTFSKDELRLLQVMADHEDENKDKWFAWGVGKFLYTLAIVPLDTPWRLVSMGLLQWAQGLERVLIRLTDAGRRRTLAKPDGQAG